jgi:hypothetical protein
MQAMLGMVKLDIAGLKRPMRAASPHRAFTRQTESDSITTLQIAT